MNGEYYHVYNRGVDKRLIFQAERDRLRFMKGIVAFNDVGRHATKSLQRISPVVPSKTPYVEVVAYTLLPNHYHFLLRQVADRGVPEFMRRVGTGFTKYFNLRYQRNGRLFQSPFQAKHVMDDGYLLHLSRYIHLNVLDLSFPEWRDAGIQDWPAAIRSMRGYLWSSAKDYLEGTKRFYIRPDSILEQFKLPDAYPRFLKDWVQHPVLDP